MAVKMYLFDLSKDALEANLDVAGFDIASLVASFGLPYYAPTPNSSNNPWHPRDRGGNETMLSPAAGLGYGVPLLLPDESTARNLLQKMRRKADAAGKPEAARVIGIELTPSSMTLAPRGLNWCSGSGMGSSFGTRRQARTLIKASALNQKELTGEGVKVFVVDQGFNRGYLQALGGTYGGGMGWSVDGQMKMPGEGAWPYAPLRTRHGSMLLRSLVDLAPDAEYYDLPLIPQRITNVEYFALNAMFAFALLNFFYLAVSGPWVILNAWGVVNRFGESLRGFYTDDRDHMLNVIVSTIAQNHDVVFAAGNSGQFCSDPRAPGYDRGPGQSIFGANGLPEVTSVGAVRADGAWIGASSQGPGPSGFSSNDINPEKPDICAPSWYIEDHDAFLRSGGSSGASAITAGAIAALRQGWGTAAVNPTEMRAALRAGARRTDRPGWNERTGKGILNLAGTITELPV